MVLTKPTIESPTECWIEHLSDEKKQLLVS